MGMKPDQFFESFVLGNYEDCINNPGCVRCAFNAAVSASHLADHYYNYHKRSNPSLMVSFNTLGDFVGYISKSTNDCFKDIRSISNAYKHLYTSTDPKKEVYSSISSAGTIESIDFEEIDELITHISEDYTKSRVVYTRKDGKKIEFLSTLKEVVDFWGKIIYPMMLIWVDKNSFHS